MLLRIAFIMKCQKKRQRACTVNIIWYNKIFMCKAIFKWRSTGMSIRNGLSMLSEQKPGIVHQPPLLEVVAEPREAPQKGVVRRPRMPWLGARNLAIGATQLRV